MCTTRNAAYSVHMNPSDYSQDLSNLPTRAEVELRAHQLWCQQGCPQGHDVNNGLEAERQLQDERVLRDPRQAGQSEPVSSTAIPASEDVPILSSDSPHAALAPHAPLATRVEEELIEPGRPRSRGSKTSIEL